MSAFFFKKDIIQINKLNLEKLRTAAKDAPLRRARFCLHQGSEDIVQEMLIAFCKNSIVPVHRHKNKTESFHIIEGFIRVLFYNDNYEMINQFKMGPIESGLPFIYRLSNSMWHTIEILSDFAILHETTSGPFVEDEMEVLQPK